MSLFDTFKTYNPVTLTVGIFFMAGGVWTITELVLHGVRTAIGGVFVVVFFVLIPVSLGMAIVHNQLRLRKKVIRPRNVLELFVLCALILSVACFGLVARYSSELRGLTLWQRTHVATLVRHEKPVGRAWVYEDRNGDYLVFVDENPDYGPYFLTANKNRAASCVKEQLGRVGSSYILTPVYVGGWKMRCITMDGVKSPDTTWMLEENSINFHSAPFDWPPEEVGDWSVRW